MGQFFTDDIDELVKLGHGDQERLIKIKAEYITKKLVTIEDRRYVEGLISRYMRPQVEPQPERPRPREERIVPPPPPRTKENFEAAQQQILKEEKKLPKTAQKKTKNIILSISAAAVAVLVISLIGVYQDQFPSIGGPRTANIELDQSSYVRGDIIAISGKIAPPTTGASLAIFNPANQHVWTETVTVRSDGTYSTLAIAGGAGWEQAGTYTVTATYGDMQDIATFSFSPVG